MNLNKVFLLLFLSVSFFIYDSAFSQSGTWTWISGSDIGNSAGVFGVKGMPSINNHPPALYEPCEWKDKQGNFWLYGGYTYSDLWKYNPATNEWTWVKGNGLPNQSPVYGTQGMPNALNTPGDMTHAIASWVDTSNTLWLFGNAIVSSDLWKYDIGSNQWTWMKGDTVNNSIGVHGIEGVPDSLNTPGGRQETCSAWTDSLNNLWLFGGDGWDDNGAGGYLNDVCKYDISTNEWTWMKGSAYVNAPANYGTKGIANVNNDPGARDSYTKWKDAQGNFWLMGGSPSLNDVWKYDLSVNEWTWMNGANTSFDSGHYHAYCAFDTLNLPCSRLEHRSAVTDNCGRFWLFGGAYNFGFQDYQYLNDLWIFDPQQLKWNLLSGTNAQNQTGNYGNIGIASPSNMPPARRGAVAWWGNDNKFYMFGGAATDLDLNAYSDVWVFNPDTVCVPVCNAVAVLPPVADFQSNDTSICANDCIDFTDLSIKATSWQWSFAGATDSTSIVQNPQDVCYQKAGIYNVTLIASNAGGRDSITFTNYIKVTAAPQTPVITQHHDTLICSTNPSYTSYQWYIDSTIISGATDSLFVFSHSGNYNVKVVNESGCNIAVGITVGIKEFSQNNYISLFPNPVTDELLISGNWQAIGKLTIFNVLGQIIYSDAINRKQETVNCKPFPSGIYFVQITTEKERWVGRFVKE